MKGKLLLGTFLLGLTTAHQDRQNIITDVTDEDTYPQDSQIHDFNDPIQDQQFYEEASGQEEEEEVSDDIQFMQIDPEDPIIIGPLEPSIIIDPIDPLSPVDPQQDPKEQSEIPYPYPGRHEKGSHSKGKKGHKQGKKKCHKNKKHMRKHHMEPESFEDLPPMNDYQAWQRHIEKKHHHHKKHKAKKALHLFFFAILMTLVGMLFSKCCFKGENEEKKEKRRRKLIMKKGTMEQLGHQIQKQQRQIEELRQEYEEKRANEMGQRNSLGQQGIPIGQVPVEIQYPMNQYGYYQNHQNNGNYYEQVSNTSQPLNRRMQREGIMADE